MGNNMLRRVSSILYQNSIIVFSGLIQFNIMPIIDETNIEDDRVEEYERMNSVVDLEDGEFRIGMEYCSRKSVVAAIRSYTISREVDYNVYEFKLQTFYAKCKTYRHGCNWCIRASLI
ncbi:hypothetical protein Ahy_A02g008276 [Arachis hypogaea]|uniref:Transposase MuDR plant domain-containing protein n=1 Tax=Arachis hypogaea TaxID=3818 RepID=A0A445EED6_ARAHY|nr:hypothetical protein Ahy_A02g008276 [Arachis hypogaea]